MLANKREDDDGGSDEAVVAVPAADEFGTVELTSLRLLLLLV